MWKTAFVPLAWKTTPQAGGMNSRLHPGSGVKEAEEKKKTRAAGLQKYSEVKREKQENNPNKYADFSPRLLLPNGAETPGGRL